MNPKEFIQGIDTHQDFEVIEMAVLTKFGREKEAWEYDVAAFCERGGILPDSYDGKALYALSDEEFQQLTAMCDPEDDALIHVDNEGFSVNHGNVGSTGIRYDFSR